MAPCRNTAQGPTHGPTCHTNRHIFVRSGIYSTLKQHLMPLKTPLSVVAAGRPRVPSSQMFGAMLAGDQTKSYKITVYLLSASSVAEAAWPTNKPVSGIRFGDQS